MAGSQSSSVKCQMHKLSLGFNCCGTLMKINFSHWFVGSWSLGSEYRAAFLHTSGRSISSTWLLAFSSQPMLSLYPLTHTLRLAARQAHASAATACYLMTYQATGSKENDHHAAISGVSVELLNEGGKNSFYHGHCSFFTTWQTVCTHKHPYNT